MSNNSTNIDQPGQTDAPIRLDRIEEAIADIKAGKIVLVVDDEDRENEGDMICAAELITPELVNFMIREARGLMCAPLTQNRCDELGLDMMVSSNTSMHTTPFTVSVDLLGHGCTTGISASDRAKTIRALVDSATIPDDLGRPGHIFPLRAVEGGVIRRAGHTEIGVDMPTEYGHFDLFAFRQSNTADLHLALVKGTWEPNEPVLVRVHSSCVTGDIFGSCRCDCGGQLHASMKMIEAEGRGVVVYMFQEGRGIGLLNKLRAYKLQEMGRDTVEANLELGLPMDARDYGVGAQILRDLGVRKLRLISNNPKKRAGLMGYGLEIVDTVPVEIASNPHNERYLRTKRDKMGHTIMNEPVNEEQ